jgi:hypothetical protein
MTPVALRFIGIGAAKCATTWTYHVLQAHPQVRFPAGKEVNFWSKPSNKGYDWYAESMADHDPSVVMGEISVMYMSLGLQHIADMRNRYPDVRLFLHVRHPVDRAWSRAKMIAREEHLDLDALSDAELLGLLMRGKNFANGDYAATLDRWLSVFPAEQLLISRFDEITARPHDAFTRLCHHIGIEATPDVLAATDRSPHRKRKERPLPEGLRTTLTRLYAEPMRRFRDEYGIDFT